MDNYRFLYRDGDILFLEHRGREVSAILDSVSFEDFTRLCEAFSGDVPAPLLESSVVFTDLRTDLMGDSRKPRVFKEAYTAGEIAGFARGFSAARNVFTEQATEKPLGTGRACAACGTYQESRKCRVCGRPTWSMSLTEAWFYGFAKLSEAATASLNAEKGVVAVSDGPSSSLISVPLDEARKLAGIQSMPEKSILRFARSRGMLEGSKWSQGFGCFSRRGTRVDSVNMLTESVAVEPGSGKVQIRFRESGRTFSVSKPYAENFTRMVADTGMSAFAAAGLMRAYKAKEMKEATSTANVITPIGQLAAARRTQMLRNLVGEMGVVEYDPKKGFAAMAIPRGAGQGKVALKESLQAGDLRVMDTKDAEYEAAAELGVVAGDPEPEVRVGPGVFVIVVPIVLCGEEDGVSMSSEEERLLELGEDGEEHFPLPNEDEDWSPEETEEALASLEAKGFIERTRRGSAYRLTEGAVSLLGRGE